MHLCALEPRAPPWGLFVSLRALPTLPGSSWGDSDMDALSLWSLGRRLASWRLPLASRIVRKLGLVLYSAYLPSEAEIGEHTTLGYGGVGVFIHPRARIGRHCLLSQFISIGGMKGHEAAPIIGDYVRVGPGARILGPVRIGDFAVIGPNAVVVRDVPAGTVVFGVPARVVRTMSDPVAEFERDTGRRVFSEDRERAPHPQAQTPAPREQPTSGRNEIRPGHQPDLFDEGIPPFVPDGAPPPAPPPGSDSQPPAEPVAVRERSASESNPS